MKRKTRLDGRVHNGYMQAFNKLHSTQNLTPEKVKSAVDPAHFYKADLPTMKPTTRRGWVDGGLCQFHDDTTPGSWRVNTDTGAYRCFACGAGGSDIISFTMDRHGLSFPEALRRLAKDWGVGNG